MLPLGIKRHILRDIDREASLLIVVGIEVPAIKGITGACGVSRALELAVLEYVLVANNGAAIGVEATVLLLLPEFARKTPNATRQQMMSSAMRMTTNLFLSPVVLRGVRVVSRCTLRRVRELGISPVVPADRVGAGSAAKSSMRIGVVVPAADRAPVLVVVLAVRAVVRSSSGTLPDSLVGRLMTGILPVVAAALVLRRGVGALSEFAAAPGALAEPGVVGVAPSRLGTRTSQGRSMGVVGSLLMSDGSLMTLRFALRLDLSAPGIWSGDPHSEQNFAP